MLAVEFRRTLRWDSDSDTWEADGCRVAKSAATTTLTTDGSDRFSAQVRSLLRRELRDYSPSTISEAMLLVDELINGVACVTVTSCRLRLTMLNEMPLHLLIELDFNASSAPRRPRGPGETMVGRLVMDSVAVGWGIGGDGQERTAWAEYEEGLR
ncbi:hypothetical protein ACPZ19_06190 [Amycolatopsis lurida]